MVVLDLQSEVAPVYQRLSSFYGQPFIWNMLHDFGGTVAMYGAIDAVNTVSEPGPRNNRVLNIIDLPRLICGDSIT